jgi:UDP-N-acetylglucosamine:LPS N-acetylglucosamine transferase
MKFNNKEKPKVVILGGGSFGQTTLNEAILMSLPTNDIEIVASVQDIKNQMSEDYFANESLKIKPIDFPTITEFTDKNGKPFERPKSKYHK